MAWLARALLVFAGLALAVPAGADGYPSHNITMVVSIGPGTGMATRW